MRSTSSSHSSHSSHRDVGHSYADSFGTDDVEISSDPPLHTRGERPRLSTASEILALPELAELEDTFREGIRARPFSTLAIGAASGAVFALTRPLFGRAPAALLMAVAWRAGRRLAWRAAGHYIHEFLTPSEPAASHSQAP